MSGFSTRWMSGATPSAVFLILASTNSAGRKSAGAAAITTASASAAARCICWRRSSVLTTRTISTPAGSGKRDVGGDDCDARAAGDGGLGQRVALAAGRPVAEEADRIEVLAGAAGGDDDVLAGEILRAPLEDLQRGGVDLGRVGQAALAGVDAGQSTDGRLENDVSPRPQQSPRWPAWRGAPTSRCASPGRTRPDSAPSAACWSAGRRPARVRPWPGCWPLPERRARGRRPARCVRGRPRRRARTRSVCTGLPLRASQVAAPTKFSDDGGGDDPDAVARLGEQAQQLRGLVGRDAAGHAENDLAHVVPPHSGGTH